MQNCARSALRYTPICLVNPVHRIKFDGYLEDCAKALDPRSTLCRFLHILRSVIIAKLGDPELTHAQRPIHIQVSYDPALPDQDLNLYASRLEGLLVNAMQESNYQWVGKSNEAFSLILPPVDLDVVDPHITIVYFPGSKPPISTLYSCVSLALKVFKYECRKELRLTGNK